MQEIICKQCGKSFLRPKWAVGKRTKTFCTVKCSTKWNANHRDNSYLEKHHFKKGQRAHNKGKKLSKEYIEANLKGENNPNWKGDTAGYKAIHKWLNDNYPRQDYCARCKTHGKTDYALIAKSYARKPEHYLELCRACHMLFDTGKVSLVTIDISAATA